jgi:methylated-DNA-[protein]-cysteine S-methyltransferase
MTPFQKQVYALVKKIPRGYVTSYKELAHKLNCKAYRAVGFALSKNPFAPQIPCHRVVRSNGSVGGFRGKRFDKEKARLLRQEGMVINKNRIAHFERVLFSYD